MHAETCRSQRTPCAPPVTFPGHLSMGSSQLGVRGGFLSTSQGEPVCGCLRAREGVLGEPLGPAAMALALTCTRCGALSSVLRLAQVLPLMQLSSRALRMLEKKRACGLQVPTWGVFWNTEYGWAQTLPWSSCYLSASERRGDNFRAFGELKKTSPLLCRSCQIDFCFPRSRTGVEKVESFSWRKHLSFSLLPALWRYFLIMLLAADWGWQWKLKQGETGGFVLPRSSLVCQWYFLVPALGGAFCSVPEAAAILTLDLSARIGIRSPAACWQPHYLLPHAHAYVAGSAAVSEKVAGRSFLTGIMFVRLLCVVPAAAFICAELLAPGALLGGLRVLPLTSFSSSWQDCTGTGNGVGSSCCVA